MTREEAIERACTALDDIASIVNKLNIMDWKDRCSLGAGTTKQDVYKAIVEIKCIVHEVDSVV